ncbi:uncharacterized protein ACR2FA_000921 [Aphomia sociella]
MVQINVNSNNLEPIELRMLKQQLANLTCKCKTCERNNIFHCKNNNLMEQGVQVRELNWSLDRFVQAIPEDQDDCKTEIPHNIEIGGFHKNYALCPSCLVTLNALHRGATIVLKDEELETNSNMFTCDKCTGKHLNYAEKTTSFTNKPELKYSNLTFSDYISEDSCDTEFGHRNKKRSSHDKVTFLDDYVEYKPHVSPPSQHTNCSCLNSFIDTIRPPLPDMF